MKVRLHRLSSGRRPLAVLVAFGIVIALGLPVLATLSPSTFNASDGNLVVDGSEKDWANIGIVCDANPAPPDTAVGCALDRPTGASDDSFGQGTKEDTAVPTVVSGQIPNNKSDLLRFYVANEKVSGKDFLYLAWERVNEPNGTTNMDFEFNQSSTISANGETPIRTENDLLIKYDLSRGGSVPTLGVHKWVVSGNAATVCEASNTVPCWGKGTTLGGATEGKTNSGNVIDPIAPGAPRTLSAHTFGEAAINLTDSGLFPAGSCINFGSAYLKSRSSDAFTSELKDFIAPISVNVSNCGTVIIRKQTDPDGATGSFGFTSTGGLSPSTFSLSDGGVRTYTGVLAGSYTVTETDPTPAFDFTSISCTDNGASTTSTSGRETTINLVAGDTVDCTYTNTQRGTIIASKVTDPASDTTTSFPFTAGGGLTPTSFNLVGGASSTYSNVVPGSGYTLAESVPTGWAQLSATCSDGSPITNIAVSAGETVTCTFTNQARGQIDIVKTDDDDPAVALNGATFTLYNDLAPVGGTRGANDTVTSKTCTTSGSGSDAGKCSITDLVPGNYWIVETTTPAGYDPAPDAAVTVTAGSTSTVNVSDPRLFKVIVVVCQKTADGTLYPSKVSFDGAAVPANANSPAGADLPAGISETALCGLSGTYVHDNVHYNDHSGSNNDHTATIRIPR
jgi:hypothetical protein